MKTTEQFAKEIADKYQVTLLGEYTGAHNKVRFLCPNGHELEAAATNLLQRGYKCKQCLHGRKIQPKITWDATAVAKLKQLISTGKSVAELAEAFSTTTSAIHNAVANIGLLRSKTDQSYTKLVSRLLDQNRELLTQEYLGAKSLVEVRCSRGHTTTQQASNIISHNTGCPQCFHATSTSKAESELLQFFKEHYHGWVVENDRSILQGLELDIVLPDLGLALEYNGGFWHSDRKVPKDYHKNKTEAVEAFGYQLLHIHETKWANKQPIVKSRILNHLGKSTKIPARKCLLTKLNRFPKQFLETNHLQGAGTPTGINYGLLFNNQLVAVMTFSKSRYRKEFQYELIRYASALNTTVVGGAGKLLKAFEQEYKPQSLVSYAARDYSSGTLYKALGFQEIAKTDPGYFYVKKLEEFSRFEFQKHNLATKLERYDPQLTEYENMQANGYSRVYDSGNLVFAKHYPHLAA